jgi:hypothetical protein
MSIRRHNHFVQEVTKLKIPFRYLKNVYHHSNCLYYILVYLVFHQIITIVSSIYMIYNCRVSVFFCHIIRCIIELQHSFLWKVVSFLCHSMGSKNVNASNWCKIWWERVKSGISWLEFGSEQICGCWPVTDLN